MSVDDEQAELLERAIFGAHRPAEHGGEREKVVGVRYDRNSGWVATWKGKIKIGPDYEAAVAWRRAQEAGKPG